MYIYIYVYIYAHIFRHAYIYLFTYLIESTSSDTLSPKFSHELAVLSQHLNAVISTVSNINVIISSQRQTQRFLKMPLLQCVAVCCRFQKCCCSAW